MFAGESVGRGYYRLDQCRYRVFGGSTVRWGGFCRPLDAHDFAQRPWIPHSGWPLSRGDLAGEYERAARALQLASSTFALHRHDRERPPAGLPGGGELEPALIQFTPPGFDFGIRARTRLGAARNVTVLLHANVTELELEPGTSRVARALLAGRGGARAAVSGRSFVLAGGGIENARLLLASRRDRATGLGNESDWVGRCFMEHLQSGLGYLVPAHPASLHPFFEVSGRAGRVQGVLTPTAAALAVRGRVMHLHARSGPPPDAHRPGLEANPELFAAYRRLRARRPALGDQLLGAAIRASATIGRSRILREATRIEPRAARWLQTIYVRAEQTPNRDSRVMLSERRDPLGMPRARLDWRVAEQDLEAMRTWAGTLDETVRRTGYGRWIAPEPGWEEKLLGGPHHMGTTRMSQTPDTGVVNRDCRVHSVENLHLAGASVFTTGGHANPSLTILALALRLAGHLRGRLEARPALTSVL